ncbi:MAG: STAS domain-containing protein [Kiritimatiellaeota bacterium]|nr:STAS domain-containing protein [Kiritimatiellota bacterium]
MEIDTCERDGVVFVSLTGRLDANTSSNVTDELEPLASQGAKILFDLENMEYISSAGLRALLVTAKKIRSVNGKMCLTGLNENVREVFDVSGFSSILDVCGDQAEALGLLNE